MKKILLLILCIPSIVFASETATFDKCVDGDTAYLIINNEQIKVRFLAVDTPEVKHSSKKGEYFGEDASDYTCARLKEASKITISYDSKSDKQDKYGRHLVWIYLDDKLFQEELVRKGYAEVAYIYNNYEFVDKLCEVQKTAISKQVGIWSSNREEGYCKTKKNTSKNLDKTALDYLVDGNIEKALELLIKDSVSIPLTILFIILLVVYVIFIKKKRKRKKTKKQL